MKKLLSLVGVIALIVLGFAGAASAQDGPSLTVDPASVDAAGEADLNVQGEGFTPGNALFVIPCVAPDGDVTAIDGQDDCDISNLTPVTVGDDGTFEADVTYEIVENFAVVAGDAAQTESAGALVTIGDGDGGGGDDDGGDDDTAADDDDTAADDSGDDDTAADDDDSTDGDTMPETGVEHNIMIGVALALLAIGLVSFRAGARLGER